LDVENLIRRSIAGVEPQIYPSTERGVLLMDSNTNLIGRNPAIDRAAKRLGSIDLNQYPTCLSDDLRAAIAKEHGLSPEEVLVGSGSDEVLDVVCKTFCNPGDLVAIPSPTFVMYSFFARIHLGSPVESPLVGADWELDVDMILRMRPKITFIASPNNPTGNAYPKAELERLLSGSPGIVVIDEAYADFCGQDFASQVRRHENLIVSRTFSKSHGLAGLRVGYGVSNPKILERMHCAKTPLTLNSFSEAIALEALADKSFMKESVRVVQSERLRLAEVLRELGLRPAKTDANFMIVDVGAPSGGARRFLRERGIVTREMGDFKGLGNHLRATVGRPEHNDRLASELKNWKASCSR
jgi:histidinol-phosphate aminotransferase